MQNESVHGEVWQALQVLAGQRSSTKVSRIIAEQNRYKIGCLYPLQKDIFGTVMVIGRGFCIWNRAVGRDKMNRADAK